MPEAHYAFPVLIDMAMKVEKSAEAFYLALSRRFAEHRSFFRALARDESNHAERFFFILGRLDQLTYSTEETRMQADQNIQVLEKTGIIGNLRRGDKRAEEASDLKSAVVAAVQLEKDTLLFYQNLAVEVENGSKREFYEIIRQEHSHLAKIENLLSKFSEL